MMTDYDGAIGVGTYPRHYESIGAVRTSASRLFAHLAVVWTLRWTRGTASGLDRGLALPVPCLGSIWLSTRLSSSEILPGAAGRAGVALAGVSLRRVLRQVVYGTHGRRRRKVIRPPLNR